MHKSELNQSLFGKFFRDLCCINDPCGEILLGLPDSPQLGTFDVSKSSKSQAQQRSTAPTPAPTAAPKEDSLSPSAAKAQTPAREAALKTTAKKPPLAAGVLHIEFPGPAWR